MAIGETERMHDFKILFSTLFPLRKQPLFVPIIIIICIDYTYKTLFFMCICVIMTITTVNFGITHAFKKI